MAPGGFASVVLARKRIARSIDQATQNGDYIMVKQVDHKNVPTVPQLPQKFAASPLQIYSPTSAPVHAKKVLNVSRVPALATTRTHTQNLEVMLDAPVSGKVPKNSRISWLTPTERFEETLNQDLEAKTRAETHRAAGWYRWW